MGPFNVQIGMTCATLAQRLYGLYANYELVHYDLAEFHVQVGPARLIKKPFSPRAPFSSRRTLAISALSAEQALAAFEWGINLAIAARINHLLLFHSAVVERNGYVVFFPLARQWQDHLMHCPGTSRAIACLFR